MARVEDRFSSRSQPQPRPFYSLLFSNDCEYERTQCVQRISKPAEPIGVRRRPLTFPKPVFVCATATSDATMTTKTLSWYTTYVTSCVITTSPRLLSSSNHNYSISLRRGRKEEKKKKRSFGFASFVHLSFFFFRRIGRQIGSRQCVSTRHTLDSIKMVFRFRSMVFSRQIRTGRREYKIHTYTVWQLRCYTREKNASRAKLKRVDRNTVRIRVNVRVSVVRYAIEVTKGKLVIIIFEKRKMVIHLRFVPITCRMMICIRNKLVNTVIYGNFVDDDDVIKQVFAFSYTQCMMQALNHRVRGTFYTRYFVFFYNHPCSGNVGCVENFSYVQFILVETSRYVWNDICIVDTILSLIKDTHLHNWYLLGNCDSKCEICLKL